MQHRVNVKPTNRLPSIAHSTLASRGSSSRLDARRRDVGHSEAHAHSRAWPVALPASPSRILRRAARWLAGVGEVLTQTDRTTLATHSRSVRTITVTQFPIAGYMAIVQNTTIVWRPPCARAIVGWPWNTSLDPARSPRSSVVCNPHILRKERASGRSINQCVPLVTRPAAHTSFNSFAPKSARLDSRQALPLRAATVLHQASSSTGIKLQTPTPNQRSLLAAKLRPLRCSTGRAAALAISQRLQLSERLQSCLLQRTSFLSFATARPSFARHAHGHPSSRRRWLYPDVLLSEWP